MAGRRNFQVGQCNATPPVGALQMVARSPTVAVTDFFFATQSGAALTVSAFQ